MQNKEIAIEILQHIAKFDQDPVYRRECRENQASEIKEMMEMEKPSN